MPETVGTLNPSIKEVQIGIRKLRKIKIYPLSVRDQLNTKGLVVDTVSSLFIGYENPEAMENTEFVNRVLATIETNLEKVLELVTDKSEDDILTEVTNEQLYEIGKIVYEVNYAFLSKLVGLLMRTDPPETENKLTLSESVLNTPLPKCAECMDTGQESSTV